MSSKKKPAVCIMDCPDSCSLEVQVDAAKVTKISASRSNPLTQDFICTKVSRFADRIYSPDRVLHPLKRVGPKGAGEFEKISWTEALSLVSRTLLSVKTEFGGETILPFSYGGSNGYLGQDTLDRVLFARLGASRLARTVCAAPTTAAALGMYGKMPGTAFPDYECAKFILIWGANPKASNIHLVPYLRKAKKAGAKIAVIDPMRNFSDAEVDLHLPVRPGTDLVVALAMVDFWRNNNLLDYDFINQNTKGVEVLLAAAADYPIAKAAQISGLADSDIERLARLYALHDPAVIRVGWGLERNRNGGQAVAAILAMPALLGKFGRKGSGYTLSNGGAYRIESDSLLDFPDWDTRTINMNQLGQVLVQEKSPPIQALFVYNCNPAATIPNQNLVLTGLARDDLFTVVSEQVMTDTAKFADIVFPATTFLEQLEVHGAYGAYALQYSEPAIAPCGEAKSNHQLFGELGRALGFKDEAFKLSEEEMVGRVVACTDGFAHRPRFEEFKENRIAVPDYEGGTPIPFLNVVPWSDDGLVDLSPPVLGQRPFGYIPQNDTAYPLALISPATNALISSTLGEFNFPELYLLMNPEDAAARNLQQGTEVRVYNQFGEVIVKLRTSPKSALA